MGSYVMRIRVLRNRLFDIIEAFFELAGPYMFVTCDDGAPTHAGRYKSRLGEVERHMTLESAGSHMPLFKITGR